MSFGDQGGAIGYLVGRLNKGLGYMFTMMNHTRLGVGVKAWPSPSAPTSTPWPSPATACSRRELGSPNPASAAIINTGRAPHADDHARPDRSPTRLAYYTATALDRAATHPHPEEKARNQAR